MNRILIEKLKMVESWRIPFLGKYWYLWGSAIDRRAFAKQTIPDAPLNTEKRDEIVICSLTSFPARIDCVHQAIKSLMLQTYKPDKIQLWLYEGQFPEKKLPKSLTDLCKYGLEIGWMDENLYGHKKYYMPLKNQKKNEVVITFDDDIIYSPKAIERLMKTHKKYPKCVVCERAQALIVGEENPSRWKTISSVGVKSPSYSLSTSTGGGYLIPFGAYGADALDTSKSVPLALKNDDLWGMFMAAENKTRIVKTRKYHRIYTVIGGSQEAQLSNENMLGNASIADMEKLKQAYPAAWQRILTDKD